MTAFATQWLALREPIDARARRADLPVALRARLPVEPLEVVDLGAGTGANLRHLAPLLGGRQRWTLVEHDAALIGAQAEAFSGWARPLGARLHVAGGDLTLEGDGFTCTIASRVLDLDTDLDRLRLPAGGLVTASALLDLVSHTWLDRLVARVTAAEAACLFALTYDGRIGLSPSDPDDALVRERFNAHQHRDKGFGSALGPDAPAAAAALLAAHGYALATTPSDWQAGTHDAGFAAALLDGWVTAAVEACDDLPPTGADERAAARIRAWGDARRAALAGGALDLTVGHVDIAAWRPG